MKSVFLYGAAFLAIATTIVVFRQFGNTYTRERKAIENVHKHSNKTRQRQQTKKKKKQRQERAKQKKGKSQELQATQPIKLTERFKSFSDDQIGIEFSHPEHWEYDIVKNQHPTRVVRFCNLENKSKTKRKKEGFDTYVFLVMEEKSHLVNLNDFINETKQSLQSSIAINFEKEEDTVVKFEENGNVFEVPAKIVTYTQGEGEMAVRAWSLFCAVGCRTICFQYLAKMDLFDSYVNDITNTIEKIRVFAPPLKEQHIVYHDRCFGIRLNLPTTMFSIEETCVQHEEDFLLLDANLHAHFVMTTPVQIKIIATRNTKINETNMQEWLNSELEKLYTEAKKGLEKTGKTASISKDDSQTIQGTRYVSKVDAGRFDALCFVDKGITFGIFAFSPRKVMPFVREPVDKLFESISIGPNSNSQYTILQDTDTHMEGLLEYLNPVDKIRALLPASTRIAVTSGFDEPLVSFCTYQMPLTKGYKPTIDNEESEENDFLESSISIKRMDDGAYLEDIKEIIETEREQTQKNNISVTINEQEICEFHKADNTTSRGIKTVETHLHTQMIGISLKVLKAFILLDDNKIFNARCMAIPDRFDANRKYFDELLNNIIIEQ